MNGLPFYLGLPRLPFHLLGKFAGTWSGPKGQQQFGEREKNHKTNFKCNWKCIGMEKKTNLVKQGQLYMSSCLKLTLICIHISD